MVEESKSEICPSIGDLSYQKPSPQKRQRTGLQSDKVAERWLAEQCIESKNQEIELLKQQLGDHQTRLDKKRDQKQKLKDKIAKLKKKKGNQGVLAEGRENETEHLKKELED